MLTRNNRLPTWVLIWMYVTAIICTWDASFIVFRPQSLPGGKLSYIWYLYKYYIDVDQRYKDTGDSFVFAQSLLNYVEVLLNILTIMMHNRNNRHTQLMAFTVTVMTFWKTVLYFLMFTEFCGAGNYRVGITWMQEVFIFIIPNGVWLLMPFLVMIKLWGVLLNPEFKSENGTYKKGVEDPLPYAPVKSKKKV